MAIDAQIRDQAYQFFTQEVPELLQILEQGLLGLRTDQSTPRIHELMRAAHSIKGGAASVELPVIQELFHRLEDVFRALYRQTDALSPELEALLFQAYDCLRVPLLAQIQTGHHDGDRARQQAEPIFAALNQILGDLSQTDVELPTSMELGIDIVQVIFSGDVESGILRLSQVVADPTSYELAGEIRAQAEVFAGIGELVNLPGFTQIAQTTVAALDHSPSQALTIGHQAIADFKAAQATVLAGDRIQGGEPSVALLQFSQPQEPSLDHLLNLLEDTFSLPAEEPELSLDLLEEAFAPSDPASDAAVDWLEASLDSPILDSLNQLDEVFGLDLEIPVDLATDLVQGQDLESGSMVPAQPASELARRDLRKPQAIAEPEPAPYLGNTVRVDLSRLDRLNNLAGELVTQENGMALQGQQLQHTLNLMVQRFAQFERITKELQDWTDRSHQAQVRLEEQPAPDFQTNAEVGSTLVDFDALQMDSYSQVQLLVQETIEEMAQFGESMRDLQLLNQQSQQILRKKQQTLKQVRDDLLWARMLPLGELLQRFPRMVRDLSLRYGKQVQLKLTGTTTLVDRVVLEKLYDPLVHLVRNAFDHGIESPELRQAQGKSATATIEIRAYHRGNQTYIEVRDDGQGINLEAVRQKLIDLQLLPIDEAIALSTDSLYEYLFTPAFSTAQQVSELSGRGMGLDAVRFQVQALKGSILLTSEPGQGTILTLRLPLTLTIAKLLVFQVNGRLMALPIDTLVSIVTVPADQIQTLQGRQFYQWQGQLIPLYPPSEFIHHYPLPENTEEKPRTMSLPQEGKLPLLLISANTQTIALEVEQILNEQELMIKPFGSAIAAPSYLYGCTILGDGTLVPVIDGVALISRWLQPQAPTQMVLPTESCLPPTEPIDFSAASILVVDDSLTTRQTLTLTLKKAGYRVLQARDGREALDQLQAESGIQAVFCDIEMPQMNGFEFLNHCRQAFSKADLPVIMLTSRGGAKHRQLALAMGASAYLTKPYLEHELLKTLTAFLDSSETSPSAHPQGMAILSTPGAAVRT